MIYRHTQQDLLTARRRRWKFRARERAGRATENGGKLGHSRDLPSASNKVMYLNRDSRQTAASVPRHSPYGPIGRWLVLRFLIACHVSHTERSLLLHGNVKS
jgi:hypothetical protein